jgi:hypothetical protein
LTARGRRRRRNQRRNIDCGDRICCRDGNGRAGWCALVFSANINYPSPGSGPAREPCDGIETFLKRPAKIVEERLAKVVAVCKRRPGNPGESRVDRLESYSAIASSAKKVELRREFLPQRIVKPRGLCLRSGVLQRLTRFIHKARTFQPCPRPDSENCVIHRTHRHQTIEKRIDPAIERNVRRTHRARHPFRLDDRRV